MSVIALDWGHLHYRESGEAEAPALIFVNSLGTDLRMWQAVGDLLPEFRLIGFDKRGHGLSATPKADWSVEDIGADVIALMDHLGIEKAVVAGCSVGGMVAQSLAYAHPVRLHGVVISNSAPKIGTAEMWASRMEAIRSGGLIALCDNILERWFAPAFRESLAARPWRVMLEHADVEGYLGTCRALAKADLRGTTPKIAIPVLVFAGTEDGSTPVALVTEMAASIPRARLKVFEGSGHIPAIDNPEGVAAEIRAFMETILHV